MCIMNIFRVGGVTIISWILDKVLGLPNANERIYQVQWVLNKFGKN